MSRARASASDFGVYLGDESLVVSSTAIALASIPSGAMNALVTNGAEAIRVRWGTPTASVGHYLNPYSVLDLYSSMTLVNFIRTGGSDSTLHITYFG